MADETGALWRSDDAGASFTRPAQDLRWPVTALLTLPGTGLIAAGPLGLRVMPEEGGK